VKRSKILLITTVGPLLGLAEAVGLFGNDRALNLPIQFPDLVWKVVAASLWGLFLPLVVYWCERDPLVPGQVGRQIPRHVARTVFFALGFEVLYGSLRWAAHRWLGTVEYSPRQLIDHLAPFGFLCAAFMYSAILGVVSALAYQGQLNDKARMAARLETELVQAELKLLKAELDPHFLFDALRAISALVYRDASAADRMISRLSDFLRLSLATAGLPKVSLQQELEHLSSYMEIQMLRFGGRLTLEVDVPTELLACPVPNLLLQPLIENVIKHAVERIRRPVRATVRARREGELVVLQILDDGPGLPADEQPDLHTGDGLTHTRGRLLKLYSAAHCLTLSSRPEGGTIATVTLPFESGESAPTDAETVEDLPQVASSRR